VNLSEKSKINIILSLRIFEEFSKIPGGQVNQIFVLFIKKIHSRIESKKYYEIDNSKIFPILLSLFTTFLFSIKLRDINYKTITSLASVACDKVVYPIMKKSLKNPEKESILFSSVLQLYYACRMLIINSEEFSSEVYTFKQFDISQSDFFIIYNEEKSISFDSFTKKQNLSEFMKISSVPLSTKVVLVCNSSILNPVPHYILENERNFKTIEH
jgi:hypothetical protein